MTTNDVERADALVMFGLTGDLGEKKLFPALYELQASGRLGIPVVGVGRSEYTDEELDDMLEESLAGYTPASGGAVDPEVVDAIELSYVSGDSTDPATYDALVDRLDGTARPVVYGALPPGIFGDVARGIAGSSLPETTRLVCEKPFGNDVESSRQLYDEIVEALDPSRLFIVDHFLAKSAIENMLTVRTSNPLIENSMCSRFVERIDIEMHEEGDVDGRGSFYESVGAIDDVVQNHLLQMLAVLTMERPDDDSDEAYHTARSTLLATVVPFDPEVAVIGQYAGYRDLDDVDDDSQVETFVEARTTIDTDRWRDVPVTIRTGKALSSDSTVATITLRSPGPDLVENRIRFEVKPRASVAIDIGILDPSTHDTGPAT
ncbi:MAG: glucose-6-phosphate dehydrogenase, partial [Ilumatobacter sp.]|uniref:glucose-6-phosphate dehydrogenase n=1 Tax=Ilumatobacter sp. TaxID=1967498 RepID=UPI003296B4C1